MCICVAAPERKILMIKLDLHGVKHEDVKNEVIRFVEENWNSGETELEIITGYSTTMKYLVRDVLDEYQLDHTDKALIGGIVQGYIRITMS